MPPLDTFKSEQQSFELIFPGKGPFDSHPKRMDGFVKEPLVPALGTLAVPRILGNVGDQTGIENALPIVDGIKVPIEIEIGTSQVEPLCSAKMGSANVKRSTNQIGLITLDTKRTGACRVEHPCVTCDIES